MSNRWPLIVALLLLTACAKPPRQELDAAEYLVARAYAFQAPAYAAEEYQAAFNALEDGRRLIDERDYSAAQASLSFARQHALRAYTLTEIAKVRAVAEEEARRQAAEEEARRQAAEEEARRLAEEEARRQAAAEEARRKAAEEEARRKAAETRMYTSYRVVSGDTLASIAALPNVYGDPLLWPLLYQGNRDQIKDPSQIDVGQILTIPRGLPASDLEMARQKAKETGLFGVSPAPPKTPSPRP